MPQPEQKLAYQIERIRAFNRFYSQLMGALGQQVYNSTLSMTEARVLYELYHRKNATARDLCSLIEIDAGYLSRILQKFEDDDILTKTLSREDARQREIGLTAKGKKAYLLWSEKANAMIADRIQHILPNDMQRMIEAMAVIQEVFSNSAHVVSDNCALRPHKAGDMGLIIHNHAVQFARDYGWNEEFEALVAEKTCAFIRNFNPARERCWVADIKGDVVGSVFVVSLDEGTGELRLLFVDPRVRGASIGEKLLKEALRFARHVGYKRLHMWTESLSHGAQLFTDAGFILIEETPHVRFGKELVGQKWELVL